MSYNYKFVKVLKNLKLCGGDAWLLRALILDEWCAELMGPTSAPTQRSRR